MAKKTNPVGDKVDRTLPFKLTDEEKARHGEIAAKLNKDLEAAVDVKKAEVSKHSSKIKDLTGKISKELRMINEGVERRPVKTVCVKNFEKNVIEFWFEGECMETVPMKPTDRQEEFKIKTPQKAAGKREKWQKLAPKFKGKAEESKDEEIASVHKQETSRKGASSAVDPR